MPRCGLDEFARGAYDDNSRKNSVGAVLTVSKGRDPLLKSLPSAPRVAHACLRPSGLEENT